MGRFATGYTQEKKQQSYLTKGKKLHIYHST